MSDKPLFTTIESSSGHEPPSITPFAADEDKPRYYENEWMPSGHSPARFVLCSRSGTGKTTIAMNLALKGFFGELDTITVFARSAFQGAYKPIERLKEKCPDSAFLYDSLDDMKLDPEVYDPTKRHCWIIDDFAGTKAAESREMMECIFTCRHYGITLLFLGQSLFKIAKPIRQNATVFLLGPGCAQGTMELRKMAEYLADGISQETFMAAYQQATNKPYGFLYIDKNEPDLRLRYRDGFTRALDI